MEFDYPDRFENINSCIEAASKQGFKEPFECGIDIQGRSHDDGIECRNSAWEDITNELYCTVSNLSRLRSQRERYRWLPFMLESYWQNGISTKEWESLKIAGFVTSYEYVAFT